MSDLKPCPFCGGEAHTYRTIAQRYCAICNEPFCANVGPFDTEAEAIAAWNSRAERTCEFSIKDNMNETEGMGDVWIECSACNCVFDYYADEWLMKMSYCPNCGCKVMGV